MERGKKNESKGIMKKKIRKRKGRWNGGEKGSKDRNGGRKGG